LELVLEEEAAEPHHTVLQHHNCSGQVAALLQLHAVLSLVTVEQGKNGLRVVLGIAMVNPTADLWNQVLMLLNELQLLGGIQGEFLF